MAARKTKAATTPAAQRPAKPARRRAPKLTSAEHHAVAVAALQTALRAVNAAAVAARAEGQPARAGRLVSGAAAVRQAMADYLEPRPDGEPSDEARSVAVRLTAAVGAYAQWWGLMVGDGPVWLLKWRGLTAHAVLQLHGDELLVTYVREPYAPDLSTRRPTRSDADVQRAAAWLAKVHRQHVARLQP